MDHYSSSQFLRQFYGPTIIRRNVGTINYKKGIITINPVNILAGKIKDGQPIIEISASPASNDVVGLQDLYLQLDISNSTFDTVVDSISSGLDPSASTYISSSSYANGALVRETGDLGTVNTDGLSTNVTNRTIATTTTTTTTTLLEQQPLRQPLLLHLLDLLEAVAVPLVEVNLDQAADLVHPAADHLTLTKNVKS